MNIQEMHSGFRTLGQQMGMQLVRGILPESIDIYLNDVIIEKTQNELLRGVNTALQDNVNLQTSTMNPTNLFRTLYRNARFSVGSKTATDATKKLIKTYNSDNGYYEINLPTISFYSENKTFALAADEYFINPMMYLSFSLEYDDKSKGRAVACRMLGADTIETTLRDFCNGADKSNPIITLISAPIIDTATKLEKTSGVSKEYIEVYTNQPNIDIKYINIKYIKAPNVVKYDLDLSKCVNCDLPEYCHFEIVEKAVQKFYASIGKSSFNTEQQKGNN